MNVLRTDTPESLKIGKKTRVVRLAREDTRVVVVRAAVSRVEVVLPPLSPDRNRCICKTRVYREGKEKKKIDLPSTRHDALESNRETTTNRKASSKEWAIARWEELWPHGNWLAFIFALRATEP